MPRFNRLASGMAAVAATAILFSWAAPAKAQSPAAPAPAAGDAASAPPTKVAVVSIRDAMTSTQEGKKLFDALLKKFNEDQDNLRTMDQAVAKMQADLNASKDKLTPAERAAREKAIQAKVAERQKKTEDDKDEFQGAQEAVLNSLAGKLLAVLGQLADSEGYDLVLDISNPQTSVMWARPSTKNLTADLVAAYDSAYPQK